MEDFLRKYFLGGEHFPRRSVFHGGVFSTAECFPRRVFFGGEGEFLRRYFLWGVLSRRYFLGG